MHLGNRDDPEFRRRVQFASFNPAWITIAAQETREQTPGSRIKHERNTRGFPSIHPPTFGSLIFNRDKDIIYKGVLFRGAAFDRYLKPDTGGNLSRFLDTGYFWGANVAQTTVLFFLSHLQEDKIE